MNEKELFNPILQNDEIIIRTFKPNKTRFVTIRGLVSVFWCLLCVPIGAVIAFLGLSGNIKNEDGSIDYVTGYIGLGFMLICLIGVIITIICINVSYKKTIYAYTNKRILIRKGIIGVDYATLDFNMIGGLIVNVGLLDKFIKKNGGTGTIIFGSAASPVIGAGNKGGSLFSFSNINDPYATYREIKEIIDSSKK